VCFFKYYISAVVCVVCVNMLHYLCQRVCVCVCVCVCLAHSLVSTVGEPFELVLVDLLDDVVLHRRQVGFLSREVLVEVVHVPFGFLQGTKKQERRGLKHPGVMATVGKRKKTSTRNVIHEKHFVSGLQPEDSHVNRKVKTLIF